MDVKSIALKEQVNEYEELFSLLPVGLYRTSIENGSFLKANKHCAKMFGFDSVDDFMNNVKSTDLYADAQVRKRFLFELFKSGAIENYELKLKHSNGDIIWVAITAMANVSEGWLQGSMMDITDRRLLEVKLEKFQEEEASSLKVITEAAKVRSNVYVRSRNGSCQPPRP